MVANDKVYGTVCGSVSKRDFENMRIMPPKNRIDKFQNEVKPFDEKMLDKLTKKRYVFFQNR